MSYLGLQLVFSLYVREGLIKGHFVLENQVGKTNSGTSRDTLNTVDIHLPILSLSVLNKVDSVIEYALNLFSYVVLEVILLV